LEEVADADLIIHVVDGSHPDPFGQVDAVNAVLADIPGAESIPRIMVFNKADRITAVEAERLRQLDSEAFVVSAQSGQGLDSLRQAVEAKLPVPDVHVHALLPYTSGSLVSRIREYGTVNSVEYTDEGIVMDANVDSRTAAMVVDQAVD
jgi:GTP-binding protein HflX